ncbi:ribosomal RNA small subunit methyltransferase E [Alphaproteobacteria bacterium]|nr:ribosomal RNA small subunit methyltransferase E [Alphaproteobacteria bacterium]
MRHIARFFVEHQLHEEAEVTLADHQMHHASNVLRLEKKDQIILFNGYSGEWNCEIIDVKKRRVRCINILREQIEEKGPMLAISLINPAKMSLLLEKTTELGVSEIIPIISQYTQHKKFNTEKARSIVIGAAEQSRRMTAPKIHDPVELSAFLASPARTVTLLVGDETMSGMPIKDAIDKNVAFLIGPEGGFSTEEMKMMDNYDFVKKVTIGRNILRSETAAITFVALWSVLWNN